MATLVSTGQITIVDTNDAKPLFAFIAPSQPCQQIFTKNDTTTTYVPDYTSVNNTLTAKLYAGGSVDQVPLSTVTNKKWSTTLGGGSIGASATYVISANQAAGAAPTTYFFECDYTDPTTPLISTHVVAQIQISIVSTGTNAVYVQISGIDTIEQSTSGTKNYATIKADLVRSSGIDTGSLQYKWYKFPFTAADQIDANYANSSTYYGFRNNSTIDSANPLGTAVAMGTNIPADGAWSTVSNAGGTTGNGRVIQVDERAIQTYGYYRVEIQDTSEGGNPIYTGHFTITDTTDPYTVELISTGGDKLANGVGSTDIYPLVYYGAAKVTDLTGWTFNWYYNDSNNGAGVRACFVDISRTPVGTGRNISVHTTGASAQFTYGGANIAFVAGELIKVVSPAGVARYYEVNSAGSNTVTIRVPATTNTWLSQTAFPAPSSAGDFLNGKLYACVGSKTSNGANANDTAAKITVTGDEIDIKGTIICEANRP